MAKPKEYSMENNFSIVEEAAIGLNTYTLFSFFERTGLNKKDISKKWFHTSLKTFQNYQKQDRILDPQESEILIKLKVLFDKGEETFGDLVKFLDWLDKPSYGLFGKIPTKLLQTITGIGMVYDELVRIEYGDFS